jgi:hypothetical protein
MRILILLPNSKGKKMLEEALIDCGASVSLIDPKTVKDKDLRTEATPHPYRLHQAFSDQTQVATHMVREHVTIPSKDFTSRKPVPCKDTDLAALVRSGLTALRIAVS